MKKQKLAVIILLIIGILPLAAQNESSSSSQKGIQKITSVRHPFLMSFSIGPNFNTGGSEHPEYFGSRADVATQFDWRMSVGLARHWNAYLDIGLSFFKIQTDDLTTNIAQALGDKLFPGLSRIKPSASIGIGYTAEMGRWQLMPRVGIGRMSAGGSEKTQTIEETTYKLKISRSSTFLNPGIAAGYRTSNLCSFILDISYRCPLQPCKATYTVAEPDLPSVTETISSRSWANDLSVSVGIQLHMGLGKKK